VKKKRMDEHHPMFDPSWSPEDQTSTLDFLSAVARGVLFAAAIAMFLTLLGCDANGTPPPKLNRHVDEQFGVACYSYYSSTRLSCVRIK
jgi:hypothetical protein